MQSKKRRHAKELIPEEELQKLGRRLKELRIAKGFKNYEAFAYEHDIPRAQYGRYETGKDLRFSSLVKVISALDITLEEFFGEGYNLPGQSKKVKDD